jgi:hypothetical protein
MPVANEVSVLIAPFTAPLVVMLVWLLLLWRYMVPVPEPVMVKFDVLLRVAVALKA